jgi:Fe-S-cluster containining protein
MKNNGTSRGPSYDCSRCPAYCCSYDRILVEKADLARLARHFGVDVETARTRFTKIRDGERVLRHRKDVTFGSVCTFLDPQTRRCTIYENRPSVCHEYPSRPRCGYYDFLVWEREFQENEGFVPLVKA